MIVSTKDENNLPRYDALHLPSPTATEDTESSEVQTYATLLKSPQEVMTVQLADESKRSRIRYPVEVHDSVIFDCLVIESLVSEPLDFIGDILGTFGGYEVDINGGPSTQ